MPVPAARSHHSVAKYKVTGSIRPEHSIGLLQRESSMSLPLRPVMSLEAVM